ncbi:MAG: ABC transporter ATP-binding protein [Candidatus Lokiarchaeota archaeon]|nr:ABC transporter ATP-binding protein [Candidatus Lokiarchaeota archaeon]
MAFIGLDAEKYDRKYNDIDLFKRIYKYFRIYKRKIMIVVLLLTIASLIESFLPILITLALNSLQTGLNTQYLVTIIIISLFFNASSFIINYFQQINISKAIGNVILDIRKEANDSILEHDLSFFDKNPSGKIVSRINTDSQEFGRALELFMEVLSSVFIVIFYTFIMFFLNLFLSLIFMIMIPAFFIVAILFMKAARRRTLLGQRATASVNAFVKETYSGIQIAKTFSQEKKLFNRFDQVNQQSYKVNLKRAFLLNTIFPSLGFIQAFVLTLIIYFGGISFFEGSIPIGSLNLFIQGSWLLTFPIFSIASFWPQLQAGLASAERIFSLIDTNPKVIQIDNIKPKNFKGKIEFKDLTFEYEDNKKVFENFSLSIEPGESIAIVGHTGAGKSSLANLITRFYEFQSGDILVDGLSIRKYDLSEYRKKIGIISQTPFLWGDTIENNIRYCCKNASETDILDSLEKTGGSEWIDDLPNGLETNIRERGTLLSMGQRQLIVLARVLLENPSILILDEATASIDPFTETKIQEALEKVIKNRTSIIIAHRLSTIRHVDRIVVLKKGKIVEEGNHQFLMSKGGLYAKLYNTYFRHQSYEYLEKIKELK